MQQWAVDYLLGVEDKDLLLSQVSTDSVPVDMATAGLKVFLEALDKVKVGECGEGEPCKLKGGGEGTSVWAVWSTPTCL